MDIAQIFFNAYGRLRSGWRLLIFVIINFVLTVALSSLLLLWYLFYPDIPLNKALSGTWGWIAQALILFVAAMLAGLFCNRVLEGLPPRALGWGLHPGWHFDFLKGTLLGAASLVLAALVILLAGGVRFSFEMQGMAAAVANTLLTSCVVFVIAAAAEEVLFRGYPLQTMARARLAWLGVILTSICFSLAHMGNPNVVRGWTFVNTLLAGVWLAVGYLRTRSLWFPLGLHWSWNWTMGSVLGLPVSGIEELARAPLMRATDVGPAWLTGGSYGIEGGAACTIALIISTIFIWRAPFLKPTPDMLRLTDQENPKPELLPPPTINEEHATLKSGI